MLTKCQKDIQTVYLIGGKLIIFELIIGLWVASRVVYVVSYVVGSILSLGTLRAFGFLSSYGLTILCGL